MALTQVHTCCGIEFALSRLGNWIFLTPLPPGAPARTWGALFTPAELSLVRERFQPDRQGQLQAIETMLTRHFAHANGSSSAAPEPLQPQAAEDSSRQDVVDPLALSPLRGKQLGGTDPAVAPELRA